MTVIITGCTSYSQKEMADKNSLTQSEVHQGYTCTMNCEKGKIYDEPGNCPRCGMELVPVTQVAQKEKEYKMDYESFPAELIPGSPGSLYFKPSAKDNNEPVPLEVVHEKKIHLIIVSEDLGYFDHVHPEEQPDGRYSIRILSKEQSYTVGPGNNETRFEQPGTYYLFADYKPGNGSHQLEKIQLNIPGKVGRAAKFTSPLLSNLSGKYTVTLTPLQETINAGQQVKLSASLYKDNKFIDASTLDNYLGAKAHIVAIGLRDKDYIHIHPEVSEGKFQIMTLFSNPGIYRAWIQFRVDGKLHTIDFTIMVNKPDPTGDTYKVQPGLHHDHNH